MDDDILIINDDVLQLVEQLPGWRIMIVDDEEEVHRITELTLKQFQFDNKSLEFLHAYSGEQAREMLLKEPNIALVLLDVVMETDDAGLAMVKYIRQQLNNKCIRIVLRTGQPGHAPEDDVVEQYDINDYKSKTELTSQKLRTLLRSSLRSYRDICNLERNKLGLEKVIQASKGIFEQGALDSFIEGTSEQLAAILELGDIAIYQLNYLADDPTPLLTTFAKARHKSKTLAISELTAQSQLALNQAITAQSNQYLDGEVVIFAKNSRHNVLFHVKGTQVLSDIDIHLLNLFTENINVALENIRLNEVIADNHREIMYRLGEVVETRSKESGSHVKRVAHYTALLARLSGLDLESIENLKQASALHDIGKVAIPDAILNKPGKLDQGEWRTMQQHAQVGHDMLVDSDIPLLQVGALISKYHHEKWDGTGYPDGLAGETIPLAGRITALADVFDALSTKRCYKEAWKIEQVMELIEQESGRHFDPSLVELLKQNLTDFLLIREKYK
ncbi:HD domain-containing phosphohydrolase [Motilimonas pumila]|uniref:DUF3369 domain-containing protein n=1 Tax=Motilimonas pumila TaxID=2303987 RepID=A0A418YB75_9GAMM|nr:HD domain-containing phosphohydrolase [Motilimonas pumila]RJG40238.1 DUF3369 domain-containing protein [Motilimonas pumila]